jgi:hypothetical protein
MNLDACVSLYGLRLHVYYMCRCIHEYTAYITYSAAILFPSRLDWVFSLLDPKKGTQSTDSDLDSSMVRIETIRTS